MSKRTVLIISAVILLLLVIAGVAFLNLNKTSTNQLAEVVTPQTAQNPSPASTKGTIQSLMSANKNTSCIITYPDQKTQGTIYVSNGKFRGDFTATTADNKQLLSHLIQSDGFGYFWTDGTKTGSKMNLEAAKSMMQQSTSSATLPAQAADLNKEVDTNCTDWTVDSSKFVVPTDVQFTDLSQMMKNLPASKSGTVAPKMDVSMCNVIKDATAKAACIKAVSAQK